MSLKNSLFAVGYFLFFMLCAFTMLWWQMRQRKTRKPFGADFKLLRGPGETQLKICQEFEANMPLWVAIAAGLPAALLVALAGWTKSFPENLQLGWLAVSIVVFIASFIVAARWFAAKTQKSHNRYLGYFGERIVAEHLEPLKQQGWRIFHDVPCQNNGAKFNIDHIAVGPTGVFVLETKTRRKGRARPGYDDHKVYFDGRQLVWPWGEDNHGLEQAERNAVWLADTLKTEIGDRVHVTPMLTLPGWWVELKPSRDSRLCRVTNPKGLSKLLPAGGTILSPQQIEAIAATLEARCRDVEF